MATHHHTKISYFFSFSVLRSSPLCYGYRMGLNVKYRGLIATTEKVALIKNRIKEKPDISRWAL